MADPREATHLYDAWQKLIPQATTRAHRGIVRGPLGMMEPCFCVNCGRPGGLVTLETPIFYLCDACAATWGTLPAIPVPDDVAHGRA